MLTISSQWCLHPYLVVLIPLCSPSSSTLRPEPHGRGGGSQPGQADSPLPEQDEEILGSDDDEQEDPNDYCRGITFLTLLCTLLDLCAYACQLISLSKIPERNGFLWLLSFISHFHITNSTPIKQHRLRLSASFFGQVDITMWRLEICSTGDTMWSASWAGGTSPLCGWPGTSSRFCSLTWKCVL